MYTGGHTRAYFGARDVQKMHVARLKFPGPATEETWVTGSAGDPLLVVMAEPSTSLAAQITELLPRLRQIAGEDRKPTLCFDRGGWSPDLFAGIIHAGFHLLTYRKANPGKDIPGLPDDRFSVVSHIGGDGRAREYELAESAVELAITNNSAACAPARRPGTRAETADTGFAPESTSRPAASNAAHANFEGGRTEPISTATTQASMPSDQTRTDPRSATDRRQVPPAADAGSCHAEPAIFMQL